MYKFKSQCALLIAAVLVPLLVTGCGQSGVIDAEAAKITKWVIGIGGKVNTTVNELTVKKIDRIPAKAFGITRININNKEHKAIDLQKFSDLKNITYLGLHSSPVSDKSISYITGLKTLEELELSNTQITDKGLLTLAAELPHLKKIFLYDTAPGITSKGVEEFKAKLPDCAVMR